MTDNFFEGIGVRGTVISYFSSNYFAPNPAQLDSPLAVSTILPKSIPS